MLSNTNLRKFVKYWRAKGPSYAVRLAADYVAQRRRWKQKRVLEICITDYCNLNCPLCSHRVSMIQNRQTMALKEFERIGTLLRPGDFREIRISGGEPTIHPDFHRFATQMRRIFPGRYYNLVTNGCLIRKHVDVLPLFHKIDFSVYEDNGGEAELLVSLAKDGILGQTRIDCAHRTGHWDDINARPNANKANLNPDHCLYYDTMFKIVQSRLYRCCVAFGVCVANHLPVEQYSVPLDDNWRGKLSRIDLRECCRHCHIEL